METLTTAQKVEAISTSNLQVAFDGCHKLYLVETTDEVLDALACGYQIHQANEIRALIEGSCFLRFVHAWNLGEHPWDIPQGEL